MIIPHILVQNSELLLLSLLLGGIVGTERERHARPAGLRTHILVCLGATLITIVDRGTPGGGGRIAAQIVTGVGFLGAGTIIRASDGTSIRGLTTAASLWVVAGLGIAAGYGGIYAETAAIATVLALVTLTVLNQLESVIDQARRRQPVTVILQPGPDTWPAVKLTLDALRAQGIRIEDVQIEKLKDGEILNLIIHLPRGMNRGKLEPILRQNPNILNINWGT